MISPLPKKMKIKMTSNKESEKKKQDAIKLRAKIARTKDYAWGSKLPITEKRFLT